MSRGAKQIDEQAVENLLLDAVHDVVDMNNLDHIRYTTLSKSSSNTDGPRGLVLRIDGAEFQILIKRTR